MINPIDQFMLKEAEFREYWDTHFLNKEDGRYYVPNQKGEKLNMYRHSVPDQRTSDVGLFVIEPFAEIVGNDFYELGVPATSRGFFTMIYKSKEDIRLPVYKVDMLEEGVIYSLSKMLHLPIDEATKKRIGTENDIVLHPLWQSFGRGVQLLYNHPQFEVSPVKTCGHQEEFLSLHDNYKPIISHVDGGVKYQPNKKH